MPFDTGHQLRSDRLQATAPRSEWQALLDAWAWTIVRVTVGALLIPHGWGKLSGDMAQVAQGFAASGMEPALAAAWFIACLEFFGGIMLVLGLLTRWVAALVAAFMAVAVFAVHWPNGFMWTNKGFEYPLMWGLMALALVVRGGGRWSLDRKVGWRW